MPKKPSKELIKKWIDKNILDHKSRFSKSRNCEIWLINNPMIPGDSGYHLGIGLDEGWVKDFRPQYSQYNTSFVKFVSMFKNITIKEAWKDIGSGPSSSSIVELVHEAVEKKKEKENAQKAQEKLNLPIYFSFNNKNMKNKLSYIRAANYLKKRAISIEEAIKYKLKFNQASIIFIYYEYGEIVYWQSRDIDQKAYQFASGTDKSSYIWGFDNTEVGEDIFLFESVFNATTVGNGGISLGGSTIGQRQIRLLKLLKPNKLIICPDYDNAGISSLKKYYHTLKSQFNLYYCLPNEKGKDFNDMAQEMNKIKKPEIIRNYITSNMKKLNLLEMAKYINR